MIERQEGNVREVKVIKHISDKLDLCELIIDFDTIKIFYDANELIPFINQDVSYSVRPDVIDGKQELVICEIAVLSNIQTVSSTKNIKLIPEGTKRTVCNFESKNIRIGEFYPNVVALMSKWELGSSPKAKWFECTMIDKASKEFVVRLFTSTEAQGNSEDILNAYIGHYVAFDLSSTKYGNQTKEIVGLPNEVEESPEVIVAMEVIRDLIQSDEALIDYNKKFSFMNAIRGVIDGEPGYAFVRMASELYMINAIDNISTDLDIRAMKRAVICSRGCFTPHKTEWSKTVLNITKLTQVPLLKEDKELMLILDVFAREEASPTKQTFIEIKRLVDNIIKIRRGIKDEKEDIDYAGIIDAFSGLL